MWIDNINPNSSWQTDTTSEDVLANAVEAFRNLKPVLIHDARSRENETDVVYPAEAVTPSEVSKLRNDAGGLVCVAISDEVAEAFDLPFFEDVVNHPVTERIDLEYDDRSSFSLTVNHRDTHTGITDNDRARTIQKLGKLSTDPDHEEFASEFRSPGHVHLLRAAPDLVADRQGHTELGLALAEMADLPPAVVVCEMLDDRTGSSATKTRTRSYARRNDHAFVDGKTIIEAYRN